MRQHRWVHSRDHDVHFGSAGFMCMKRISVQLSLETVHHRAGNESHRGTTGKGAPSKHSHNHGVLGSGHQSLISSGLPQQSSRLWESLQALQRPSAAPQHVRGRPGVRLVPGWSCEVTALELTKAGPRAPRLRNGQGTQFHKGFARPHAPAWQRQ